MVADGMSSNRRPAAGLVECADGMRLTVLRRCWQICCAGGIGGRASPSAVEIVVGVAAVVAPKVAVWRDCSQPLRGGGAVRGQPAVVPGSRAAGPGAFLWRCSGSPPPTYSRVDMTTTLSRMRRPRGRRSDLGGGADRVAPRPGWAIIRAGVEGRRSGGHPIMRGFTTRWPRSSVVWCRRARCEGLTGDAAAAAHAVAAEPQSQRADPAGEHRHPRC